MPASYIIAVALRIGSHSGAAHNIFNVTVNRDATERGMRDPFERHGEPTIARSNNDG